VTITSKLCSYKVFINNFLLPCGRVKNQSCQVSESDLCKFSLNSHLKLIATLSYSEFESIQLQREESGAKSNNFTENKLLNLSIQWKQTFYLLA